MLLNIIVCIQFSNKLINIFYDHILLNCMHTVHSHHLAKYSEVNLLMFCMLYMFDFVTKYCIPINLTVI